jgi:hypothetical protein
MVGREARGGGGVSRAREVPETAEDQILGGCQGIRGGMGSVAYLFPAHSARTLTCFEATRLGSTVGPGSYIHDRVPHLDCL